MGIVSFDSFKQIRYDLESYSIFSKKYNFNRIYFLAREEKEKYELIEKWLKEDFGFLDVVIDFKDYKKLDKLFSVIPNYKTEEEKRLSKNIIIREYLCYTILKNASIEKDKYGDSIKDVGNVLFEGDYNSLFEVCGLTFLDDVEPLLKQKALDTPRKMVRIHFLLDGISDTLQTNINDLFMYRSDIAMLGYTTEDLKSYYGTSAGFLDSLYDCSFFQTKDKVKELVKEGKLIGGMIK